MSEIFWTNIIYTAKFIYNHLAFYAFWFGTCISILAIFIPIRHNDIKIKRERIIHAKDGFLAIVADQRAKFYIMESKGDEFFEQSIPVFIEAVHGTRPFLCATQWDCLNTILEEYQSHDKSEFESGKTERIATTIAILNDSKTPSQILLDFLNRFEECIHKKKLIKNDKI